jgi:hypothetical protein
VVPCERRWGATTLPALIVPSMRLSCTVAHWRAGHLPAPPVLRGAAVPLMALATTTRGSGALPRPVAASAWEVVGRPPTRINVRTPITGRWPAPVVPVIIAWSVELWQTAGLLQLWPALPACSLAVQHPRDLGEGPVG